LDQTTTMLRHLLPEAEPADWLRLRGSFADLQINLGESGEGYGFVSVERHG
jgi:hypothetical protein